MAGGRAPDTPPAAGAPPKRVQLSRAKGWRMPPNTVKVDLSTSFGNPFVLFQGDRAFAVAAFRRWIEDPDTDHQITRRHILKRRLGELRGRDLACWCDLDQPCHADVLLELANLEAER